MKMKKLAILFLLIVPCIDLFSQEWSIPIAGEDSFKFWDVISVDKGESVLGIGCIRTEDGYIAKTTKEGDYIFREVHLPGMMLQYYSAVELDNGNYMVFGVCDDSLCDYHIQKYLCVDVYDNQLEAISSCLHEVDDDVFDCFYEPWVGDHLRSLVSKSGSIILATSLSYYVETNYGGHYSGALRFYEFDESGNIIRFVDQDPITYAGAGAIKEITYAPNSDNIMVFMHGGEFPPHSGCIGIYVANTELQIVARQHMLSFGELGTVVTMACEGKWIDNQKIIVDIERYIGSSFNYHTLFVTDSALNIYAELRLPPYDSCTWVPRGTNTAYINDSTIVAFSYSSERMFSDDVLQVNVTLVDKHLNLLGRKVLKREEVMCLASSPAAFNDGGCAVLITSYNGVHYQGPDFFEYDLMKFRREDIKITWDVIEEELANKTSVFPNPTKGIINIPLGIIPDGETRIQIFDIKGVKCLDCAISKSGNLITLDTQNLESGLYLYKVVSGNALLSEGKFVKE